MRHLRGLCFWEPNSADPDRWTVHSELDDDRMSYPENMTTYLLNVFGGAQDYFVYHVERTAFRLPVPVTPAHVPREVTVPLTALQRPGPVTTPELTDAGLPLEVLPPPHDVFLALRVRHYVSVELVDEAGEWVGAMPVGLPGRPEPLRAWA